MSQASRFFRAARTGLVLVLSSSLLFMRPLAQEQAPPVFRGGIDAVSVDVIVTDKQGRPVTDLTAADFEVREAGDLQTVTTFRLVETGDGTGPAAAREILSLDQERTEAARLDNRLFVVFLDDYHVRRGNSMRSRQQLADFLRSLSRNDLVAIATPLSGVGGMTFSRNHNLTSNVVMGFEGRKYDYTPKHPIEYRYQTLPVEQQEQMRNSLTITALQSLSEYLGTLREGRKTIIYVSEGMSGSVPSGVRVTGSWQGSAPLGRAENSRTQSMDFFENAGLLVDLEARVFRSAVRNNVSIYTLDPRGLSNFEFGVNEDVTSETDRRILQESTDLLRVIAEQTDGRAIVGRNDPIPALRQMVQDNSAYYLLGYTSTRSPRDGKFHEIRVRVNRRDVEVRARKGYWAYTPEDVARATTPTRPESPTDVTEALDAMRVTTSERSRPINVWMGALRGATEKAAVTFAWETRPGAPTDPADAVDRVSIVATTLAGEEVFRGAVARDAAGPRGAGKVTFEAPAGPLRVRVTSENARGLRLDTDEASLEVPDFSVTGPRLTTPFLYRGRTARDLQLIRQAAAPVPVVTAVFARAERMLIRFGAYGAGGTAPALSMRLLNQVGQQLAALPAPVARPDGGGLFESELGLGSFPPGEYLVEIAAEQGGESVKKLVALRVTG
ncbi:MAG: VWA domain-containing protein [Acidobacteria bacterium]|nr:VWA domain-containing protein [Acidobacteriota bacterium]